MMIDKDFAKVEIFCSDCIIDKLTKEAFEALDTEELERLGSFCHGCESGSRWHEIEDV